LLRAGSSLVLLSLSLVILSPIRFAQGKLFACHPERSEGSQQLAQGKLREGSVSFRFNTIQGCFAKFTLSPFAVLRAVRSGMANGLSMTI